MPGQLDAAGEVEVAPMCPGDVPAALALWSGAEGLTLRGADQPEPLARYLARNPGLSLVARHGGRVVGAVLCGHDGRRGYLHHLAVDADCRRRGIGRRLAEGCLAALREIGIHKCHLFVRTENDAALAFWTALGWERRSDIATFSHAAPAAGDP